MSATSPAPQLDGDATPATCATRDPQLRVRILRRVPLHYRRGADAALDRPAHVRASSALCRLGSTLVVLQDDAAFLGVIDPVTGWVDDLPLPAGPDGRRVFDSARGNKAHKPDFELAFADGDRVVALGSGGLAARQRAVSWRPGQEPQLVALPRLYEQLRVAVVAPGTLNLEGSARLQARLFLANRGGDHYPLAAPSETSETSETSEAAAGATGETRDVLIELPRDALAALLDDPAGAALPALQLRAVDLGSLPLPASAATAASPAGEPRLHFTDLAPRGEHALWYLAAAEHTTTFYDDGEVAGSALGTIELPRAPGLGPVLRFAPVLDEHGALATDKLEGVCAHDQADRLWAVTDPDAPDRPGELLELALTGPW